MSEDLKLMIAVLIKNTIVILEFIGLAIYFNNFWLSLLSVLFMTTVEKTGGKENKENE